MKSLKSIIKLLVLAPLLAFSLGFAWFVQQVQSPGKHDGFKTEALVVLTGGSDRIEVGFDLLRKNYAKALFISGVYQNLDAKRLLQARTQNMDLHPYVFVGLKAENTKQNAIETYEWLKKNNYTSFRLITAGYHMPRSLIEFRRVLPSNYMIIPHNVVPRTIDNKHVWSFSVLRLLIREYLKYIVVRFLSVDS